MPRRAGRPPFAASTLSDCYRKRRIPATEKYAKTIPAPSRPAKIMFFGIKAVLPYRNKS
jgi:hypothetical protein